MKKLFQKKYTLGDANVFITQGNGFYKQGKLTEALGCYQKSLEITERLAPGSLDVAASYNNRTYAPTILTLGFLSCSMR